MNKIFRGNGHSNLMTLHSVLFQRGAFCLNHIRSKMNGEANMCTLAEPRRARTQTRSGGLIELQPHPTSRNTGAFKFPESIEYTFF